MGFELYTFKIWGGVKKLVFWYIGQLKEIMALLFFIRFKIFLKIEEITFQPIYDAIFYCDQYLRESWYKFKNLMLFHLFFNNLNFLRLSTFLFIILKYLKSPVFNSYLLTNIDQYLRKLWHFIQCYMANLEISTVQRTFYKLLY